MTPETIAALFTRADGDYFFARWQRPIVPVVFGVEEQTLATVKGALEAVVALAGHRMAQTDPEQGANLMMFFIHDWDELLAVPDLDRLVPNLTPLVARLKGEGANQYRVFRFEADGAIRAAVVFVRLDAAMAELPATDLALLQAVQAILLWSDRGYAGMAPFLRGKDGAALLRPELAALIRAAYDPVLPDAASDASHALRLAARLGPAVPG
ncbi:MAG: hypothetical protein JJT95_03615 [Pararhodobacter sp.]|nr:hypothetical protein [Pararhodobacter sp.]